MTIRGPFHRKDFKLGKYRCTGLISEKKTKALYVELNERAEAATSSYSATRDFLQYICYVLVAKNHQKVQSRCLVHGFSFTELFKRYNRSYIAAILKKNFSWLLLFYVAAAVAIMKSCAERYALQLYRISLKK